MEHKEVELKEFFSNLVLDKEFEEGKYEDLLYDKFEEAYHINDYEVLSNDKWLNIEGVGKTKQFDTWVLKTSDGNILKCADEHIVVKCIIDIDNMKSEPTYEEIFVKDLEIGDMVLCKEGIEMVMEIYNSNIKNNMYDLQLDRDSNHLYYTNNILSHNSLWMQNISSNVANQGKNVVYFTLEMSEAKVLKRLGAMRLKIPINDYDEKSKDINFIKNKIQSLHEGSGLEGDPGGIFENKMGKVNVKFFAAGTANINDFENHLKNLEIKKGFKPDLIVVDYITLMAPIKSLGVDTNLYMKGKHLAESLRSLAAKYNVPLITAVQVAKDAWNASDITLDKVPESKAIAETADIFAAIIRTEEMRVNNRYALKLLKQRDGDFSRSRALFDLNPKYLTIENDRFGDDVL